MARPIKNNADYFPHDADMRNDPKIKAVRRKFGIVGYGVYSMLLELMTDAEFFQFKNDAMTIEIIAGDFDIKPDKLTTILLYLSAIDLIQIDPKTNIIACKSLGNRLEPLLSKRKRDRTEVIASDNTQSKVKESKGEKEKEIDALTLTINTLLKRNNPNTMDVRMMVTQWVKAGYSDIQAQIKAMQACYGLEGLVFPTKIETLTQSFANCDWIEKFKSLDPERKAEQVQKEKHGKRKESIDDIGCSAPGSTG